MNSNRYLAHLSEDKCREQTLMEHLCGTAKMAGHFASKFDCEEQGRQIGAIHDLGKGTEAFQKRLLGGPKVDHSTAGAKELFLIKSKASILASYCVAGHHSGLPDGGTVADGAGTPTLWGRMKKNIEDYSVVKNDFGKIVLPEPPIKLLENKGFSLSFYTRMLFSCLVDADYLDTENFMQSGNVGRFESDSIEKLLCRLERYIEPWLQCKAGDTIDAKRTEILKACLEKSQKPQGLFQLTVPTGGGKTVSSLAFALRHGVKHSLDRIIYVLPYTSIIEQNAEVFRSILGKENVLEDHYNVEIEDEDELKRYQLAAENYDKPIVVTTNVQFFESLFSNKTSKCRKLHNFAKSIIIFDEAQMLPADYLLPCLRGISELVCNYHCTAVLCTATQPALKNYFPKEISESIYEICPNMEDQYDYFRRTKVENIGEITEENLIDSLYRQNQVLCILNTRKEVNHVYEKLRDKELEGTYHLSTLMYPEHRKRVLKEIRERLQLNEKCRVVATSLIEAGVDVDFPSVFREIAGIDSIIQASGRCNREGRLPSEKCKTLFFSIQGQGTKSLSNDIKQPVEVAKQIIRKYEDVSDLKAINEYFKRLYKIRGEGLDAKQIIDQFENGAATLNFPFASVAKRFHLIEQETYTVFIAKDPCPMSCEKELRQGEYSRQLMREVSHYCVNIYRKEFQNLYDAGSIEILFDGFAILTDIDLYDEKCGLKTNSEIGVAQFV